MTLFRVVAPHFVAGVLAAGGTVYQAAPILRYMEGWHTERAGSYARRKGWTWERL